MFPSRHACLKPILPCKIARSWIWWIKIGVCPLNLQLFAIISIRSLESLSTMRWVKPCPFAFPRTCSTFQHEGHHNLQFFECNPLTDYRLSLKKKKKTTTIHKSLWILVSFITIKFYPLPRVLIVRNNSIFKFVKYSWWII
jgi:hypothetical protein